MYLDEIVKEGAIIISPYTNFNVVLGMNIAQKVAELGYSVYMCGWNTRSVDILEVGVDAILKKIVFVENLDFVPPNAYLIAMFEILTKYLYKVLTDRFRFFTVFAYRKSIPRSLLQHRLYIVRKVDVETYTIVTESGIAVVKLSGGKLVESDVPEDVMNLIKELRELIAIFGSVKASHFVKYFSKKYGYSREKCIDVLRKAIAMGIVKYSNGYLYT